MNFAEAFHEILAGRKVRRKDWNRPYAVFLTGGLIERNSIEIIVMLMKNGRINAYTPSQCDMLAADWELVK